MSTALVAKSYVGLQQLCDPYEVNGKQYVKVRMRNGNPKVVRAYSEAEYRKYNPEVKIIQKAKSQKDIFGFGEQGFIWIFKGDTYAALDWFRMQPTRYAKFLGWYLPSNIEMPNPLPVGVEPIKLEWDKISDPETDAFLPEEDIQNYVNTLVYDPGVSDWVGNIKERITADVVCTRILHFQNAFGISTMFMFEDTDKNILTWTTQTTQNIEENCEYIITGTVTEHLTYKNVKQTLLTRCKVIEEKGFE